MVTRFRRVSRKGKGIDNFINELFLDGDDIRNGMLEIRQDCVYLPINTDCASAFTNQNRSISRKGSWITALCAPPPARYALLRGRHIP